MGTILSALISTVLPISLSLRNPSAYYVAIPKAEPMEEQSAISFKQVNRARVLEQFFAQFESPLQSNAQTFVGVADKYGLDYRILPAISCIESTCGKYIVPGSYNPFGWGIYGGKVTTFESFDQAIERVGRGISENYVARGYDTLQEMAPIYTPSNHVKWLASVTFFMNEMDEIALY